MVQDSQNLQTLTTADGTIIKGVVASVEFKIKNVKFVAKNVTVKMVLMLQDFQ